MVSDPHNRTIKDQLERFKAERNERSTDTSGPVQSIDTWYPPHYEMRPEYEALCRGELKQVRIEHFQ